MKKYTILTILFALFTSCAFAQIRSGLVSNIEEEPLVGASIALKDLGSSLSTDLDGQFTLPVAFERGELIISYVGYVSQEIKIDLKTKFPLKIILVEHGSELQEVVINTGYYEVPKERATGSFTHVDNETLNRSVGSNILQRLEGVASGIQFVNANGTSASDIRVRGLATLMSDETPLIVVDNFPYEGDINSINPNDVESITVLKDAAAASIWGARAGNGVIVVTTKNGRYNQRAKISYSGSVNIGDKPDLFYSQKWLPSETVMGIEKELFDRNQYVEEPKTPLPGYVELLIKQRDGLIDQQEFMRLESIMKQTDVRRGAMDHLYRQSLNRQHSLNISGGGDNYRYYLSTGLDQNSETIIGNDYRRMNLNLQNTFKPLKGLEVSAGVWYSSQMTKDNGLSFKGLDPKIGDVFSPYLQLVDEDGTALPIPHERRFGYYENAADFGLLDWHYRPLDEVTLADNKRRGSEYRLNSQLKYSFLDGFDFSATYQYRLGKNAYENYHAPESYFVRNLVNQFTSKEGKQVIPHNGILDGGNNSENTSQSARAQLNYNRKFSENHRLTTLVGGEIRGLTRQASPGYRIYDFDREVITGTATYNYDQVYPTYPEGSARLPVPSSGLSHFTDRYLSYFGNMAYTQNEKYTVSGSVRWDASNLFGVKTNQKGVPLWSVGTSWILSDEKFYAFKHLPYLRLRATYGSSGNVNKQVSVFPVVFYSTETSTKLPITRLTSIGNPSLRWEKVNTINLGLDFGTENQRIDGSLEYYVKKASDLIGEDYMAPSTGVIDGNRVRNMINYANIRTHGWDVQLRSKNLEGKLKWRTAILLSYVRDEITHYNTAEISATNYYLGTAPPVVGKSRDVVYAYPWYGLNPQTGMPLVMIDGEPTLDHKAFIDSFLPEDMTIAGVKVPPYFGSVRNTLRFGQLELSANILWKAGYVFRRSSMAPASEYAGSQQYHMDYFKRWQKPGDEKFTDVPAWSEEPDTYISTSYSYSSELITKGNHIRLQDINFSYSLVNDAIKRLSIQRVRLSAYARNLGVIWKSNKNGIDPDYANSDYPPPKTIAFSLQVDF